MKTANIDALTGLRGLAAWMVVLYHFREFLPGQPGDAVRLPIDGGYLAVDLFFILSGLVLYINYHHQFERLQPAAALGFYFRRIARIYPLHIVVLCLFLLNPLAIALFSSAGNLGDRYDPVYFLLSVFLVQNWGFTPSVEWNIPAWSISTEFAAYLLFPLLVVGLKGVARRGAWWPLLVYGGLVVATAALFAWRGLPSIGEDISRMGVMRCLLEFSMGLVLGYYQIRNPQQLSRLSGASMAVLLLAVVGLSLAGGLADYLVAPLLFTLLIVGLLDARLPWSRMFAARPLLYLGEISYSTYMIHYFVKDWVKFLSRDVGPVQWLAYLLAVFALSVLLYRWVEHPFRTRAYHWLSRTVGGTRVAQ